MKDKKNRNSRGTPISELGWTTEDAAEARARLSAFAPFWDDPSMDVYDEPSPAETMNGLLEEVAQLQELFRTADGKPKWSSGELMNQIVKTGVRVLWNAYYDDTGSATPACPTALGNFDLGRDTNSLIRFVTHKPSVIDELQKINQLVNETFVVVGAPSLEFDSAYCHDDRARVWITFSIQLTEAERAVDELDSKHWKFAVQINNDDISVNFVTI